MEKENKKEKVSFFDLPEEEQKRRQEIFWKKFWKIAGRILLGTFCVGLIVFMIVALVASAISSKNEVSESASAIINLINLLN